MYVKQAFPKPDKIVGVKAAVAAPGVSLKSLAPNITGKNFSIESLSNDVFISLGSGTEGFKVTGVIELTHPSPSYSGAPYEDIYVYGTGTFQLITYSDNA